MANETFPTDDMELTHILVVNDIKISKSFYIDKLGADLFRNLRVVIGAEHGHEAQQPKSMNLNEVN